MAGQSIGEFVEYDTKKRAIPIPAALSNSVFLLNFFYFIPTRTHRRPSLSTRVARCDIKSLILFFLSPFQSDFMCFVYC